MKRFPSSRTQYVKVGFKGLSDEKSPQLTDPSFATSAMNFAFEDGCLTGKIGIDLAVDASMRQIPDAPGDIADLFFYRFTTPEGAHADRLVARLADNTIWQLELFGEGAWTKVLNLTIMGDDVKAVNYNRNGRDILLFCSKGSPLFILDDKTPFYCADAPSFSCFEIHSERLFGGVNDERVKLWFSDDFDPMNWRVSADEAGYIQFDDGFGEIIDLKSFFGYLYIFREYGIFRLTAFGKQSEFVLKRVFADAGKIVKNSIVYAGGSIIFMMGKNLFEYDGYTVSMIAKNLPEFASTDSVTAAYSDGCYYICGKLKQDSAANDALFRYSLNIGSLSGMDSASINRLTSLRAGGYDRVLACFSDEAHAKKVGMMSESGKFLEEATKKSYVYAPSSLGVTRLKTVEAIELTADAELRVTIVADGRRYGYDIKPNECTQRVKVGARGRMIGVEISSDAAELTLPPITLKLGMHAN